MDNISFLSLQPRAIFARDDNKKSNFTCARPHHNEHGEVLGIGITFKALMLYITIACLGLTAIISSLLIWKHLHRYTNPKEQRQNIRVIFMPVFYALISLFAILFYEASIYFAPLKGLYEAFCISALFFLFLEYVCPDESKREEFFSNVENKDRKGKVTPGGSLLWYNRTSVRILQFPLTKTILIIVEGITQAYGVYCPNSLSPNYAHLWVLLISIFIIGGALEGVFQMYDHLKPFDRKHNAVAKLATFQGILLFQFVQDIIFGFLNGKTFKPSPKYTYNDIYYGVPMMLTAIEALIASILFHFAFRSREYHESEREDAATRLPVWRAIIDALDMSDIVLGVISAIKTILFKSSPNGHGLTGLVQKRLNRPRRQRTQELDAMAYESTRNERHMPHTSPPPQAYHGVVGEQRSGVVREHSNVSQGLRAEPRTWV